MIEALMLTVLMQVPLSAPACEYSTWEWNTDPSGEAYQPQTFAEDYAYTWFVAFNTDEPEIWYKWPLAGQTYTHPNGLDAFLVCFALISQVEEEYCARFESDWWNCPGRDQPTTTTQPTTTIAPASTTTTTVAERISEPPRAPMVDRFALCRFLEAL